MNDCFQVSRAGNTATITFRPIFRDLQWSQFGGSGQEVAHEVQHFVSTSRAAIAAEICRSTTRKDYPLEKARIGALKNDLEMDLQTRIEILATQILLFLEELTFSERVERLCVMLDLLWSAKENTPATTLAGLVSMVNAGVAQPLWEHCCERVQENGFPNDDALIAAFSLHQVAQGSLPSRPTNKAWALLQLLIAPASSTKGALCRIFQVFGRDANSIHQGLLLDLLKKETVSATDVHQVLLMLETLARALEGLELEMVAGLDLEPDRDAGTLRKYIQKVRTLAGRSIPERGIDSDDAMAKPASKSRLAASCRRSWK